MTDDDALETVSARFAPGDDPPPVGAPPVVAVGGRPRRRLPQLFVVLMLVVAAGFVSVTFLGRSASSRFSSVGSAVSGGGGSEGRVDGAASRAVAGAAAASAAPAPNVSGTPSTLASTKVLDGPPNEVGRKVVSTASVTIEAPDVLAAKSKAAAAVADAGGYIFDEQTNLAGRSTAKVTFKVPPDALEKVIDELAVLGSVSSIEVKTDDVTQQVVDLDARIRAADVSLARVRDLVGRSGNLNELAALENEVQRRQTELESLQGQRATLADRTDHATIVLDLRTPMPVAVDAAAGAGEQAPSEPPGFLDGLRVGWNGFVKAATVASAGVGLALPFAWLAVPVVVVVFARRRRRSLALSDA